MEDASAMEWRIRGYSSTLEIYKLDLPQDRFSREQVIEVLKILAGRQLTGHEVSGAVLGKNDLLKVRVGESPENGITLTAGQNPHYVAGLFRKDQR
jgi:hypothetical protein